MDGQAEGKERFEGLSLLNCLDKVEDPRLERKKLYPLREILLIALCAMLSGVEGFRAFEIYGEEKIDFLRRFYAFENGIPSHDTFARVLTLLDAKHFAKLLEIWTAGLRAKIAEIRHIAVDGKTLRGSFEGGKNNSAVHVVEAFASDVRLVLAQVKAAYKGYGENDALLEMLATLDVRHATITIDAIGCQKKVAENLVSKKADYILALKGNQGEMYEAVKDYFEAKSWRGRAVYNETVDKGHGRIEIRRCWVSEDLRCLEELGLWPGIRSIVRVEAERTHRDHTTKEVRYFISSLPADAKRHLHAIRSHWSIEALHWVMDMTFTEDKCRARTKNAPENMAILRRICSNILQKMKGEGESLKGMRLRASCNDEKLFQFLGEI
jgi:predicted transposase YbfD/YdcC